MIWVIEVKDSGSHCPVSQKKMNEAAQDYRRVDFHFAAFTHELLLLFTVAAEDYIIKYLTHKSSPPTIDLWWLYT